MGGIEDLKQMLSSRSTDYGKMSQILSWYLLNVDNEISELRKCLTRRSSHINAIIQKALELGKSVPVELRKVMDDCIVEEDKAIGYGVFSIKRGDKT